jgi:hypothetical protein
LPSLMVVRPHSLKKQRGDQCSPPLSGNR